MYSTLSRVPFARHLSAGSEEGARKAALSKALKATSMTSNPLNLRKDYLINFLAYKNNCRLNFNLSDSYGKLADELLSGASPSTQSIKSVIPEKYISDYLISVKTQERNLESPDDEPKKRHRRNINLVSLLRSNSFKFVGVIDLNHHGIGYNQLAFDEDKKRFVVDEGKHFRAEITFHDKPTSIYLHELKKNFFHRMPADANLLVLRKHFYKKSNWSNYDFNTLNLRIQNMFLAAMYTHFSSVMFECAQSKTAFEMPVFYFIDLVEMLRLSGYSNFCLTLDSHINEIMAAYSKEKNLSNRCSYLSMVHPTFRSFHSAINLVNYTSYDNVLQIFNANSKAEVSEKNNLYLAFLKKVNDFQLRNNKKINEKDSDVQFMLNNLVGISTIVSFIGLDKGAQLSDDIGTFNIE